MTICGREPRFAGSLAHSFDVVSFLTHRSLVWLSALVVAIALAVALVLGVLTAPGAGGHSGYRASPTGSSRPGAQQLAAGSALASTPGPGAAESKVLSSGVSPSDVATRPAGELPLTSDPQQYAIAYASALFSYDTLTQSEVVWTAVLTAGLDTTADVRADNTEDLANRTPPTAVWQTMASSNQRATFAVTRAWVPQLWTQNASHYPAGATVITVSGTQEVAWTGGSSEVPQSVTLLLLCPPYNSFCVVNRIAAQVLQ